MRRVLVAVAVLTALALGPGLFASASQLAVVPASITPTMVATVSTQLGLALTNGGTTAGQAETGDKLVVTFPRAIDASTLCSTWPAAPTTAQTISANNSLIVTVTDGGAVNDALSISASGVCGNAVNLGTVDLGGSGFAATGALTFSGNGAGGRTTMTYDPTTAQVVITFGARAGTAGTVASSVTATFTASSSLKYGDGSSVAPATASISGVAL